MDRNIALLLIFSFCIIGPCWVFSACGKSSINALGRNPSAAPRIFTAMIIVLIFANFGLWGALAFCILTDLGAAFIMKEIS